MHVWAVGCAVTVPTCRNKNLQFDLQNLEKWHQRDDEFVVVVTVTMHASLSAQAHAPYEVNPIFV